MGSRNSAMVYAIIYNVMNYLNNIKNSKFKSGAGITLVEILVVIFIIALFSSILVADFPEIKRQFALTRAVHKMSQDLRRVQDMGLSGQKIKDNEGNDISVKSYGLYIDINNPSLGNKKYIIYADINEDQKYDVSGNICGEQLTFQDCIIETIDFSQIESAVFIDRIENTADGSGAWIDINFKPPNPTVTITNLSPELSRAQIIFTINSVPPKERIVFVNKAGLIEIK